MEEDESPWKTVLIPRNKKRKVESLTKLPRNQ